MGLKVKKTYKASRLSENEHSWHRSFVFRMPGMQQKARSTPSSTRRSTSSSSLPITSGAWPSRTAGPVATSWISSTSCVAPSRSSHTCRWASLSTHSLVVVLCSFIYTTLCVFPVVVLNVCRAVCTCVCVCDGPVEHHVGVSVPFTVRLSFYGDRRSFLKPRQRRKE